MVKHRERRLSPSPIRHVELEFQALPSFVSCYLIPSSTPSLQTSFLASEVFAQAQRRSFKVMQLNTMSRESQSEHARHEALGSVTEPMNKDGS